MQVAEICITNLVRHSILVYLLAGTITAGFFESILYFRCLAKPSDIAAS